MGLINKIDETYVTVDRDAGKVVVRQRWNLGDQMASLTWQGVELPVRNVVIEEVAESPLVSPAGEGRVLE